MSADLRRRSAPSARAKHGGEAIDVAEEIRLRTKLALSKRAGILIITILLCAGSTAPFGL